MPFQQRKPTRYSGKNVASRSREVILPLYLAVFETASGTAHPILGSPGQERHWRSGSSVEDMLSLLSLKKTREILLVSKTRCIWSWRLLLETWTGRRGSKTNWNMGNSNGLQGKAFVWLGQTLKQAVQIVGSPSLEILRTRGNIVLKYLLYLAFSGEGGWARWLLEVPSYLRVSVIHCSLNILGFIHTACTLTQRGIWGAQGKERGEKKRAELLTQK